MLKAYDIDFQYLGERGYAFQRLYELKFRCMPNIPFNHQERPSSKYSFYSKNRSFMTLDNRDIRYNLLCGKTLKVGGEQTGCMIGMPIRTKLFV